MHKFDLNYVDISILDDGKMLEMTMREEKMIKFTESMIQVLLQIFSWH